MVIPAWEPGSRRLQMFTQNYYFVYILANQKNGTLYVGVTRSLVKRVWEHKIKRNKNSFTSKYNINKLVYYQIFYDPYNAIAQEKRVKKWNRKWKLELIEKENPDWLDLSEPWYKGHEKYINLDPGSSPG
jgi:putative endonuclease